MSISPDYRSLAAGGTRWLADIALDGLVDAVLVIDARQRHLPIMLANAAARRALATEAAPGSLIESTVYRLLAPASAVSLDAMLASLANGQSGVSRVLSWHFIRGETLVVTELKALPGSSGQRLVMLRFAASSPAPDLLFAIEQLPFDLLILDGDLHVTYANAGAARSGSSTPGALLGRSALTLTPTGALPRDVYVRALEGIAYHHDAVELPTPDGPTRVFEMAVQPLNGATGIVALAVLSTEITERRLQERKQAEHRLVQREEIFRLAADAVDGVIFEWDVVRGVVHRSRGVFEVLGIEPEDLAPAMDAWCERIHPRDFAVTRKQIGLALISGRGWETTYRIRDARGRYRSMLERGLIQRNPEGDPVRVIGCAVDVSEIKRLTDLLADTQRTAQMGGWEYSYPSRELTWTDEMFRIYDTTPGEFVVSWESMLAQCTPESRQRFSDACTEAEAADGQLDLELEITTLKNQRIWVRIIGHLEQVGGRPFRSFGSVQNIQAQKLAQMTLEHSTGWLKLSMNMAQMHAWRWDRAGDLFEFASVAGLEVHLPSVFQGMNKLMTRVHPEDLMAVRRAIDRAFQTHTEVQEEFRLRTNDGQYRSYATIARPLFDAGNVPRGLVGVTRDVTARRDSEVRLRRSEELLRATTANTADVLVLVDPELRIRFINKRVRGMAIEHIIGREITVLVPEAAGAMVVDKLNHALRTGETVTYEFQSLEEGQEVRYFENRAVLVRDDGIGTGISISVSDITERKRLEREVLDVSSRERQSIGRDLHDGLGQELTGIALMLRGLATKMQRRCPEVVEDVNEVVTLVNQSIESARALARGILPVRSDSGGLEFALQTLAARSRDAYGLEVVFRAEVWPELTLNETSASHLYRIAQEALTNAARHGHASRVDILLSATQTSFLLRITDNGAGIDTSAALGTGMGLKIMKYRAGMIGAKFDIAANAPRGTVVRVTGEQPLAPTELQSGYGS